MGRRPGVKKSPIPVDFKQQIDEISAVGRYIPKTTAILPILFHFTSLPYYFNLFLLLFLSHSHLHTAKKRAVTFLDQCLCAHHLSAPDHQELIVTVSKALGISSTRVQPNADDEDENTEEIPAMEASSSSSSGKQRSSSRVSSSSSSSSSKSKPSEEHNEVCEVCEKGGDLLCCDSCTLVFHVKCIRPKLSSVPKGRWSCAHCVADGMGPGDEIAARKALVSNLNGT